jgi:uncharacterized protein (TIGR00369 family)
MSDSTITSGVSLITLEQFRHLVSSQLPLAKLMGFDIVSLGNGVARAKAIYQPQFLRPGGTIAGPIMMGLADYASYGAVLSAVGLVELAVTTNLAVSFLRKPQRRDLYADARLLSYADRLAVVEVDIVSGIDEQLVARSSCTYAVPAC